MEEFDELLPTPDSEGSLELSHRAWTEVDEIVWTMGEELFSLSLAHNRLRSLSPELGDLKQLLELDCSCNQLEVLPERIGNLKHLRRLKVSGNKLTTLPDDIGKCLALEELIISENDIVSLPRSLGKLRRLKALHAQNNCLEMIPPTLADISTLTTVNCRNNPRLAMLPKKIRGDSELILWVCRIHRASERECAEVIAAIDQLSQLTEIADTRHDHLTRALQKYNDDRLELLRNMPTGFDRALVVYKALATSCSKTCVLS